MLVIFICKEKAVQSFSLTIKEVMKEIRYLHVRNFTGNWLEIHF